MDRSPVSKRSMQSCIQTDSMLKKTEPSRGTLISLAVRGTASRVKRTKKEKTRDGEETNRLVCQHTQSSVEEIVESSTANEAGIGGLSSLFFAFHSADAPMMPGSLYLHLSVPHFLFNVFTGRTDSVASTPMMNRC